MPKTPYMDPPQSLVASPFNQARRLVHDIEGKWDAAIRALEKISAANDLRDCRQIANETLDIMRKHK